MKKTFGLTTALISLGILGAVSGIHAQADTLSQAQKQVKAMDEQYEKLTKDKDKLVSANKKYQAQLLETQLQLNDQKQKVANFVQNVQASSFSQGYVKMLMSSKGLDDLVTKITIANNFARVNQSNLQELRKTMQKLKDTSSKNNATISNITREEKSIEETLKAKKKLVSNIEVAQNKKVADVESVDVPKPETLVQPEQQKEVETPKAEDVLAEVAVATPQSSSQAEAPSSADSSPASNASANTGSGAQSGTSGNASGGSSSGTSSSNSGNDNSVAPTPSQPNIEFVKMPSDGVGFDGGQCTYGADELLGGAVPNWWGNAVNWYANAQAQGLPTGSTPAVGALVVYGANANIGGYITGYQGHVGVVQSVQGSNIVVKEMNGTSGTWNYDVRTGSSSSGVLGYIYIK